MVEYEAPRKIASLLFALIMAHGIISAILRKERRLVIVSGESMVVLSLLFILFEIMEGNQYFGFMAFALIVVGIAIVVGGIIGSIILTKKIEILFWSTKYTSGYKWFEAVTISIITISLLAIIVVSRSAFF